MTLPQAYYLLAAVYAVFGGLVAFAPGVVRAFPRSTAGAYLLFGGAGGWFMMNLWALGEADLAGIPRELVLGGFGFSAVAAFRLLPDFLAVRGLAGLLLLTATPVLDAGFGKTPQSLLLAGLTYVLIVAALVLGTAPYLMRDLITAAQKTPGRSRATAFTFAVASAACAANAVMV